LFLSQIFSNSNFVQNLKKIKIKICSNLKYKQISKFKIIQILEKKTEKRRNREETPPGPAQQGNLTGGANSGAPAGGD
jgi:hypothetical protein